MDTARGITRTQGVTSVLATTFCQPGWGLHLFQTGWLCLRRIWTVTPSTRMPESYKGYCSYLCDPSRVKPTKEDASNLCQAGVSWRLPQEAWEPLSKTLAAALNGGHNNLSPTKCPRTLSSFHIPSDQNSATQRYQQSTSHTTYRQHGEDTHMVHLKASGERGTHGPKLYSQADIDSSHQISRIRRH